LILLSGILYKRLKVSNLLAFGLGRGGRPFYQMGQKVGSSENPQS
jgi:hypothetical protein